MFVADDLGGWLVGLLADAGRKKLTTVILGSEQDRALRRAATAAVRETVGELRPADSKQARKLEIVVSQLFKAQVPDVPSEYRTLLQALQARIAGQLEALDDAKLVRTGQSAADLFGVPALVLAEKLTVNLLREIRAHGARGGPLAPLADQLNHDETHLKLQHLEVKLLGLPMAERQQALVGGSPPAISDQLAEISQTNLAPFRIAALHMGEAARRKARNEDYASELDRARGYLFQAFEEAVGDVWRLSVAWHLSLVYAVSGDEDQVVRWLREAEKAGKAELNRQCAAVSVQLPSIVQGAEAQGHDMGQRPAKGWFLVRVTCLPEAAHHPLVTAARSPDIIIARPNGQFLSNAASIQALGALVDGLADLRASKTNPKWLLSIEDRLGDLSRPGSFTIGTLAEGLRDHRHLLASDGRRWTVTLSDDSPLEKLPHIPGQTLPAFRIQRKRDFLPWLHFTDWVDGIDIALQSVSIVNEWRRTARY